MAGTEAGHEDTCHAELRQRCAERSAHDDHGPFARAASRLAVRAQPDELEASIVQLPVDPDEARSDMEIAVIAPLSAERVIEIAPRQWLVFRQCRLRASRHRDAGAAGRIFRVCSLGEIGRCP